MRGARRQTPIKKDITIVQWNSRSLKRRISEFKLFLYTRKPDIVAIQETWYKNKNKTPTFISYEHIRKDRINRPAGGIMLLMRDHLQYEEKAITEYNGNKSLEVQVITVKMQNSTMDVVNIYNPKTTLNEREFQHYMSQVSNQYIMVGDLNGHHHMWDPERNGAPNQCGRVLHDIVINSNNIAIATPPSLPTYTNSYTGESSTIDLILCTPRLIPYISTTTTADLGSDHEPILSTVTMIPDTAERGKKPKWILEKSKFNEWKEDIMNLPPTAPEETEEEQKQFTSDIINVSKKHFKKTSNKIKSKFNKPWWNEECAKATALRRRAQRKMRRLPSVENIREYRRLTAAATRIHNKAKRESFKRYTNSITAHTPPGETWKFLISFKGKTGPTSGPLHHRNGIAFTKEERAEVHGKYFKTALTKKNNLVYTQNQLNNIERAAAVEDEDNHNSRLTREELERSIKNLDDEKAYGSDEIHNQFLKNLPPTKVTELLGMFNRSWTRGEVPKEWKKGIILPFLKPGKEKHLPENYRPITLLSRVSALLESMVGERLTYFAEKKELLSNTQYGFRFRRSTIDPILDIEHKIRCSLQEKQVTIVVFFDLKAAYDSIDHTYLLATLAELGVEGTMFKWIRNLLSNRTIQVAIEDILSSEMKINNGVVQGSGISTIVFDMIMSTIPTARILYPATSNEFADDVAYTVTEQTLEEATSAMQDAIDRFSIWAKSKGLTISTGKTKAMCFTSKHDNEPSLTLNNEEIEVVNKFKYLGMVFDAPLLTWKHHITKISNDCHQGINIMKAISSTKWGANRETLTQFYTAFIKSRIAYGSAALLSACPTNLAKLEVIQNTALRLATGASRRTYIPALQCEANTPPVELQMKQQGIKEYYKLVAKGPGFPVYETIFGQDLSNRTWSNWFKQPFILHAQTTINTWNLPQQPRLKPLEYPKIAPWEKLEEYIHTQLARPTTKSEGERILQLATHETIATRYENHLQIYTDGSKTENPRSTAAAFCVPSLEIKRKWKLNPNISIEGAELSAILKATDWLKNQRNPRGAVILSDSQVGLNLISKRKPRAYEYSVSSIQQNIKELRTNGWEIMIQWIPGHCNIPGNTLADELANQGHALENEDEYPLELKELMCCTKDALQEQWQNHWNTTKGNCALGTIKENTKDWPWARHHNRAMDTALTRLRLDCANLKRNLFRMNRADTPNCAKCPNNREENAEHYLLECTAYNTQRRNLREELRNIGILDLSMKNLMGGADQQTHIKKKITRLVANYIRGTKRLGEL